MVCGQWSGWATGIVFLCLVTIIWSFASFLTQYIYADLNFESPFILTFISSSFFSIYLPAWQLWVCLGWVKDLPRLVFHVSLENLTSYHITDGKTGQISRLLHVGLMMERQMAKRPLSSLIVQNQSILEEELMKMILLDPQHF